MTHLKWVINGSKQVNPLINNHSTQLSPDQFLCCSCHDANVSFPFHDFHAPSSAVVHHIAVLLCPRTPHRRPTPSSLPLSFILLLRTVSLSLFHFINSFCIDLDLFNVFTTSWNEYEFEINFLAMSLLKICLQFNLKIWRLICENLKICLQ